MLFISDLAEIFEVNRAKIRNVKSRRNFNMSSSVLSTNLSINLMVEENKNTKLIKILNIYNNLL